MASYDERALAASGFFGLGSKPKYKIVVEVDGSVVKETAAEGIEEVNSKVYEYVQTMFDNKIESRTRIRVVCTQSDFTHFDGMLLAGFRLRESLEPEEEPATEATAKPFAVAEEPAEPTTEPEEEPATEASPEAAEEPSQVAVEPAKKRRRPHTTMDDWGSAVEWARKKGVRLRNGRVSLHMMRIAIHDSGLWEVWNATWPAYSFDEDEYLYSMRKMRRASA